MPYSYMQYQVKTEPVSTSPETVTESRWHQPWSEPVRYRQVPKVRIALAASGLFFTPQPLGETVNPDKYYIAWTDPVRFKQGLRPSLQQSLAMGPTSPVVSFGWYGHLSEPVRKKIGLRAPAQMFLALQPQNNPSFAWFAGLSEPKRFRRGIGAPWQQFYTADTAVIPTSKMTQWFANLSEPVRFKRGLRASLQQTTAWPPRLLPTPTITGTMGAIETKDTMLGSVSAWNQATSAEIGIVDTSAPATEIGVVQTGPSGTIASVRVSIRLV